MQIAATAKLLPPPQWSAWIKFSSGWI